MLKVGVAAHKTSEMHIGAFITLGAALQREAEAEAARETCTSPYTACLQSLATLADTVIDASDA